MISVGCVLMKKEKKKECWCCELGFGPGGKRERDMVGGLVERTTVRVWSNMWATTLTRRSLDGDSMLMCGDVLLNNFSRWGLKIQGYVYSL